MFFSCRFWNEWKGSCWGTMPSNSSSTALRRGLMVQISGNMDVAKGALMEIASRLRDRIIRPANAAAHPGPNGHFQGFPTPANFSVRGPMPSGMIGSGSSGGYDHLKGGGEAQGYPVRSTPMGYSNLSSSVGLKIPNRAISSVYGMGGSNISNCHQVFEDAYKSWLSIVIPEDIERFSFSTLFFTHSVFLPKICGAQGSNSRREMAEIKSSSIVAPAPGSVSPLNHLGLAPVMVPAMAPF